MNKRTILLKTQSSKRNEQRLSFSSYIFSPSLCKMDLSGWVMGSVSEPRSMVYDSHRTVYRGSYAIAGNTRKCVASCSSVTLFSRVSSPASPAPLGLARELLPPAINPRFFLFPLFKLKNKKIDFLPFSWRVVARLSRCASRCWRFASLSARLPRFSNLH